MDMKTTANSLLHVYGYPVSMFNIFPPV